MKSHPPPKCLWMCLVVFAAVACEGQPIPTDPGGPPGEGGNPGAGGGGEGGATGTGGGNPGGTGGRAAGGNGGGGGAGTGGMSGAPGNGGRTGGGTGGSGGAGTGGAVGGYDAGAGRGAGGGGGAGMGGADGGAGGAGGRATGGAGGAGTGGAGPGGAGGSPPADAGPPAPGAMSCDYVAGATGREPNGQIPSCCTPGAANKANIDSVFRLLNAYRTASGISALAYDANLERAIHAHCVHMQLHSFFDHAAPEAPVRDFGQRVKNCGGTLRGGGENIAKGQRSPDDVMNSWKTSPGHDMNMRRAQYRRVGIGEYQLNWGQVFAD